jgi:DNA-binding MarR family transcriptional regulator
MASRKGIAPGPAARTTVFEEITLSWRRELPAADLSGMLLALCFTRLGRLIDADYDRWGQREAGLTGAEMRVILALRRAGHPYARRPTDLFRALLITSGAITKQVDRLAAKQLVVRTPDPQHSGGFLVMLTASGRKLADRIAHRLADESILKEALAELDEEERQAGIRFCRHLIGKVEKLNRHDRK